MSKSMPCWWKQDFSGIRIAVTRPNFIGLPSTSPMPDIYWNDQLQPHFPRMGWQKALPTDGPLRPQFWFFETWQLQVTSLQMSEIPHKGFHGQGDGSSPNRFLSTGGGTMQYSPVATQFGPPASAREQWPHPSDPASSESEAGDRKHLDYL